MGAGCPLGAHRQERGAEQAAVSALGLLLPALTCSDSHHAVHPRLPALVLRRCQAPLGRGKGVPQAGKDKTLTYPTLPPPLPLPTGPKARGYGSCPTPQGMPPAPMAGMDWRLPWPGAGDDKSASSGSRLLALTRTRFLEKG